jgi:hypothetical protein
VAYSTWAEVLDEIQHERPTVLHLGFPSEHHTGIHLFRDTVQPERMLSAITAWNKLAARNGGTDLRHCAECLRVRRARAEARRVYRLCNWARSTRERQGRVGIFRDTVCVRARICRWRAVSTPASLGAIFMSKS